MELIHVVSRNAQNFLRLYWGMSALCFHRRHSLGSLLVSALPMVFPNLRSDMSSEVNLSSESCIAVGQLRWCVPLGVRYQGRSSATPCAAASNRGWATHDNCRMMCGALADGLHTCLPTSKPANRQTGYKLENSSAGGSVRCQGARECGYEGGYVRPPPLALDFA